MTYSQLTVTVNSKSFTPTTMSGGFRFAATKAHFTYKTHVDMDHLLDLAKQFGKLKMSSIVHEVGDEDEDHPTPYEHTHAFFWWVKPLDVTNPRAWDVNGQDGEPIHPNLQNRRSMKWAQTICMKYHLGHKTKANGKKYFIEPIEIRQEGVEEWKMSEEQFEIARNAPTAIDACMELGIDIKSVSDVMVVRRGEKMKRGYMEVEEDCDKPWRAPPVEWDRKKKSLILKGPPGTGKTNWAAAQFTKPWAVKDIDDLKDMPADVDGLVFDDCEFNKLKDGVQKYIFDVRTGSSIHARHQNAYKPKLPAIFTTNDHYKLCDWDGCDGALKVRAMVWDMDDIDNKIDSMHT